MCLKYQPMGMFPLSNVMPRDVRLDTDWLFIPKDREDSNPGLLLLHQQALHTHVPDQRGDEATSAYIALVDID